MISDIRSNLVWTFASRYSTLILGFASAIALARLLSPEEIGIYSIAAAFFSIGQIFRDFGIGEYIIREKELTKNKLASAFTVSITICWTLALLFFFLGHVISNYYQLPELVDVFRWLVLNFVLIPFGTISLSVLKRERQFKKLMLVDIATTGTHTLVGIGAAYYGFSYLSLAWASVAGTAMTIITLCFIRPKHLPWLPGFSEIKHIMAFGWKISWAGMAKHLNSVAPEIIVGKIFGPHAVAILNKGMSTTRMFGMAVTTGAMQVIHPVFAEIQRSGGDLKPGFLFATAAMTAIAWPFFGYFALMADQIVPLLFGDQWTESIPYVRISAAAAILFFTTSLTERVLIIQGKAGRYASLNTVFLIISVSLILVAAQFSLYAVGASLILERMIRLVIMLRELKLCFNLTFDDYRPILFKGITISLSSLLPAALITLSGVTAQWPLYATLGLTALLTAVAWCCAVILCDHPIKTELLLLLKKITPQSVFVS